MSIPACARAAFCIVLVIGAACSGAQTLAERLRQSVFELAIFDAEGDPLATSSGFVVSSDGFAITNHHSVRGASSATARFESGQSGIPVELWAVAPQHDLALLRLEGDGPFVALDLKAEAPDVGQGVFAAGFPKSLGFSLTRGVVSSVQTASKISEAFDVNLSRFQPSSRWIYTDTAINSGNSGGPLVTVRGNPVGVSTLVFLELNDVYLASHIVHAAELFDARPSTPIGFEAVADSSPRISRQAGPTVPYIQIVQDKHPQAVRRRASIVARQLPCRHCRGNGRITESRTVGRVGQSSRQVHSTARCETCDGSGFRSASDASPVLQRFIEELARIDRDHPSFETEVRRAREQLVGLAETNADGLFELFRGGTANRVTNPNIERGTPVWGHFFVVNSVETPAGRVWICGLADSGILFEVTDLAIEHATDGSPAVFGGIFAGDYVFGEGDRLHVVQSGFLISP